MLKKWLSKWLRIEDLSSRVRLLEGNFDVKVHSGASLPVDKEVVEAVRETFEKARDELVDTIKKGYSA